MTYQDEDKKVLFTKNTTWHFHTCAAWWYARKMDDAAVGVDSHLPNHHEAKYSLHLGLVSPLTPHFTYQIQQA